MVHASHPERRGRDRRRGLGEDGPERRLRELLYPLRLGRAMARRGVRTAILAVLAGQPMHGYHVMQELESRSGGRYRPSAGSVYPTLQQLEDEGMVRSQEIDGRRVYTISDAGKAALAESPLGGMPLFDADGKWTKLNLRKEAIGLVGAAIQVSRAGSPEMQAQAREILVDARRRLYRLLAEDEAGEEAPEREPEGDDNSNGGAA